MFKICETTNSLLPLEAKTFSELGFKERANLQEWIAKRPSCLGEDLLIIQKEFAGFDNTNERLDLLAIDKEGALVLIENKLDDTGRDVTWQALKYASYCSGMSKETICNIFQEYLQKTNSDGNAKDLITDFLEADDFEDVVLNKGFTQRIILIAANFRKEVTSTVLWLLNFRLRVHCFQVKPFSMNGQHFLNIDQIIPTKGAEDYMIGIADKAMSEIEGASGEKARDRVRRDFWAKVIAATAGKTPLFQNISPSTQGWISAGSGTGGVGFNFAAGKNYARVEIYIDRGDREENKAIFDALHARSSELDEKFGGGLVWERLDTKRASRIKAEMPANIFTDEWPPLIEFMVDAMKKMEATFKEPIAEAAKRTRPMAIS